MSERKVLVVDEDVAVGDVLYHQTTNASARVCRVQRATLMLATGDEFPRFYVIPRSAVWTIFKRPKPEVTP